MQSSENEIDLELIAAFIDGRLFGAERARAVKLIASSEAALEVYSDALRVQADLGPDNLVALAPRRERKGRWWQAVAPLAAAAVLLIAIFPTVKARRDQALFSSTAMSIAQPVMGRAQLPETLGNEWEERNWSVTRGTASRLIDSTIAFRLGVRAVDLQIALVRADTVRAVRLTDEILESLQLVPLSEFVKADYSALRARLTSNAPRSQIVASASRAEEAVDAFLGSRWFGFGKWLGAGEIAARTRSPEFFASERTVRFLDWAIERGDLAPNDVALLRQIRLLAGQGVADEEFDTIRQIYLTLIRRHGG
jgi:hypothetical protein